jgi:hypothetical protein
VTQFLYSPGKPDLRTTPTFRVNYGRPGRFTIRVNTVSHRSKIHFILDGVVAREIDLHAAPPADPKAKPEYESTEHKKEWNVYQAIFNKEYSINVPAGRHTITLANVEGDWASLEGITLENYRSSRYPAVNTYGLVQGRNAVLWIQNAHHNWKNVAEKKPLPTITRMRLPVRDLPDGRYVVEWWDTWRGEVTKTTTAAPKKGVLELHVPDLATDVAVRIVPADAAR